MRQIRPPPRRLPHQPLRLALHAKPYRWRWPRLLRDQRRCDRLLLLQVAWDRWDWGRGERLWLLLLVLLDGKAVGAAGEAGWSLGEGEGRDGGDLLMGLEAGGHGL